MSGWTSSLRQTERRGGLLAAACVATLALAAPGWAASLPTPDDPPTGPRSEAAPRIAVAPKTASAPLSASQSLAPSPDAPVTATSPRQTAPRPTAVPPSAPATSAPSSSSPAATPSPITTTEARASEPEHSATRPRKTTRPGSQAHPAKASATPRVAGPPHDGNRLGLPLATLTLSAVATARAGEGALLTAAALLLVAAGAGGLVVGLVGRRLARIA